MNKCFMTEYDRREKFSRPPHRLPGVGRFGCVTCHACHPNVGFGTAKLHFIQKHAPFVAERPVNAHHPKDPAGHAGRHFLLPRGMPSRSSRSRNFILVAAWVPLQGRDASPGCRTAHKRGLSSLSNPHQEAKRTLPVTLPPWPRSPCPMTVVGSVVDLAPVDCTDNGIACRRHEKKKRGRMPRLALPSAGPWQEARRRQGCFCEISTGSYPL